jgi:hypothetical protein
LVLLSIPLLAGSGNVLANAYKKLFYKWYILPILCIIGLSIISIQLVVYYIQTGHFFVYSYTTEKLNLLQPHFIDFLFSYKKGFFLYTPLAFIILLVWLITNIKKNVFEALSMFIFLATTMYFLSCWWNWWYGWSFSQRPMVEYLPYFGYMCAMVLWQCKTALKRNVFLLFCIFCVALCQLQTYQYRYYILDAENNTKAKYWQNFLKTPLSK